ncbi:cell cycle protein, FtsW/RodA/SpoVE domain protein [Streptococcus ictaluri 707-05]|uniref:Cell cycle protein, FtsW/RodA/SpoVE domain protein n=1 Tax=Streptococcus ictaluri 707-05 TaxID=764299 RepID=G5K424_9STRE|nr:cell cycle protein, FtsW/RodA/SpoVE domain protein [Streptococcus ictaluri 707-05]
MLGQNKSAKGSIDYAIILPVSFLLLIGLLSIFVAVSHDFSQNVVPVIFQQVIWILVGILFAFLLMLFNKRFLWTLTPFFYILGLALMVLPLIFYSPQLYAATGSKNWITVGSMTLFQPSEFMKIAYILAMARLTVWFQRKKERTQFKDDWKLLGLYLLLSLPVMILLALQKDFGTALVFVAILAGMVLISGISWWIILPILLFFLLLVGILLLVFLIPEERITFKMGSQHLSVKSHFGLANPL